MEPRSNFHHRMTTQAEVLPRELRLGAPPTMPQARSYLFKQKSTLSEYPEKSVIQINIPRLQRSYLSNDSYLQFTVELTATPGGVTDAAATAKFWNQLSVCLDNPGAYGIIDKIEVYDYLGSTLLESTAGHGQLASLILDCMSSNTTTRKMTAYAGTGKTITAQNFDLAVNYGNPTNQWVAYAATYPPALPATNVGVGDSTSVFGPISGQAFNFAANPTGFASLAAANTAQTVSREFSIPLFSFLGLLSPKYAPLHNGFTLQITLNSQAIALGENNWNVTDTTKSITGSISSYKIKDVFYCAQVLELGPVAESMLLSSTQGNPLIVHSKAYRNYVTNMEPNTSQFRMDLNLNVASLSAILWIMRPTENLGANAKVSRSLSQRIRNYLSSWYFQYGSSILPQTTGIKAQSSNTYGYTTTALGTSEAFIELMKAVRKNNDMALDTAFTDQNFRVDTQMTIAPSATAGSFPWTQTNVDPNSPTPLLTPWNQRDISIGNSTATQGVFTTKHDTGRFACGLNLELSPEHSYELISGLNTNGMNISINASFSQSKIGSQQKCQIDAWCEYDAFINITPGLATTVSF